MTVHGTRGDDIAGIEQNLLTAGNDLRVLRIYHGIAKDSVERSLPFLGPGGSERK